MKNVKGESPVKEIKECDHTSVGILVWQEDKLLLIERKKFPFGFAPPAGHLDGDLDYEIAVKRELEEEVGLKAAKLNLIVGARKNNPCRRPGGTWHYWKIYQATVSGDLKPSPDETKQAGWYTKESLRALAERTKNYLTGKIPEEEWQQSPGLEAVWREWFKELQII